MNKRRYIQDTLVLAFSAFGGPQAHIAMLFELFVNKRKYLSEEDLIELNALCSFLPGPTSTQTITAIGYKIGGIRLGLLTLLIWITPAAIGMIGGGLAINYLSEKQISLAFTKPLQAIAIGLIGFAAYKIFLKVVQTTGQKIICVSASLITVMVLFFIDKGSFTAFLFPVLLVIGGFVSVMWGQRKCDVQLKEYLYNEWKPVGVKWNYLLFFLAIFFLSTAINSIYTLHFFDLFERSYRNGCFIYGGGQVLMPLLQVEFVDQAKLVSNEVFLTGVSLASTIPGPMFSISGYLGTTSSETYGMWGQFLGGTISLIGIFLPGTLLIFFVYPMWEQLKRNRIIKRSLSGVNAVAAGFIIAACFLLFFSLEANNHIDYGINGLIVIATFIACLTKKISVPMIILVGLIAGLLFF